MAAGLFGFEDTGTLIEVGRGWGGCSNVLVAFVATKKSTAGTVKPCLRSAEFIKTHKKKKKGEWPQMVPSITIHPATHAHAQTPHPVP